MAAVPGRSLSALLATLSLLGGLHTGASQAQTAPPADRDKLSDAERAKRDAEKVFSFIKFHTVKPQRETPREAAAAPAAARPAARPSNIPATSPATALTAALRSGAEPVAAPAPAPSAAPAPAAAAETPPVAAKDTATASRDPAPALPPPPVGNSQPAVATTLPPATQPAPTAAATPATTAATAPDDDDEVPLKLIAYTAPVMNAQVLAALPAAGYVVPVRFTVQPNGVVSQAEVRGVVPRAIGRSAISAIQQWRFDPIPAVRQVDVEIAFKAE